VTNWRVAASEGGTGSGLPDRLSAAEQALLDRRVVLVSGRIDDAKGAAIAASLMVLAALGDEPVEMRISAESDSLERPSRRCDADSFFSQAARPRLPLR